MNRIQQQAAAEALGMSADEMGKMLIEQKAITALSGVEGKTAQEKFNTLVKEVGLTEAKKQLGDETLANQLASVSSQEQFNQVISKLREVFVQVMTPLMPLISGIASILSFIAPILPTITAIAGFLTGNPFLIAAGGLGLYNQISAVGDAVLPASGEPIVSTQEGGIFKGTRNDDILMGPGLASTAINIPPSPPISIVPNIIREENRNTTPSIDYNQLADAIAMGAEKGTSRANITTNLDGARVSNRIQAPLAVNTRKYSV
jgi:hypothetical protein